MQTTTLSAQSTLPLTCSRSGTCCFGKTILLNPWEVFSFSKEKKMSSRAFRDQHCEFGGIQLRFNGKPDKKGQPACSQYVTNVGCSVYLGRPLACRLYPLGRQIQNNKAQYMYQGEQFPCLNDCSEVLELPKLTVGDYIKGQEAVQFENAQDAYVTVMENIADISFELLLDSGLAASEVTKTLALWREMGNERPELLAERIGEEWIDCLMIPAITDAVENPVVFAQKHLDILLLKAQEKFGSLESNQELHEGAVLIMGVALHLARGLGADPQSMAEHWIATAKSHGAQE